MIEPGAVTDGADPPVHAHAHADTRRRWLAPSSAVLAFGGVIGWSAFLLFSVEPLIGRLVLPVFGGTPAVWATTLFFFQAVLLLGYLYGHLSVTRLGIRRGAVLHIALVLAAGAALALSPARPADLRDPAIPDVLNLVGMLALTIGLAAFVLTTTTPLVSAWYAASRTATSDGGDAYWLYALSNAGSLLALLAYPFLIEPRLGLSAQRGVWAVGFVVFALAIAGCAAWASGRAGRTSPAAGPDELETTGASEPIAGRRRATWLLLAAVPSGLLSAVTTFIATDLVSAPLLWLVPLAIYLLTFIVAFSDRGRRMVPAAALVAPAAVTLMWVPFGSAGGWPILPLVVLMYGGLGVVATAMHGRLAMDRPDPAHLTEFYLVISIGGALASAFVALFAPILFPGVWEFPILLVLALVALAATEPRRRGSGVARTNRPPINLAPFVRGARSRVLPYLAVAAILVVFLVRDTSLGAEAGIRWLLVGGLILLVGARPAFLATSTALVLALAVLVLQPAAIFRDRSFFGVTEVLRPDGAPQTTLMNGTTVHGVQWTDSAKAQMPTAYYAPAGPFGDVFAALESDDQPKDIAIVGLGAGALTSYLRPNWTMTYFEIDPLVAEVASDPRFFTFLSSANPRPSIVLGDARLSLSDVPAQRFDALFVDAFSSDAVPTHLLTSEAYALYARLVKPGGLVVTHIPNRYYDLAPAVAGAQAANGLTALIRTFQPTETEAREGAAPTILAVASSIGSSLADLRDGGWQPLEPTVPPMTDDFMDALRFLRPLW
ncbi:MAG: fused MFS/spermidine synthase [Chloroflexi bacterium]|nr:fused MFS/spermidine synthase [Chloroflexota bacterium]